MPILPQLGCSLTLLDIEEAAIAGVLTYNRFALGLLDPLRGFEE
jgi:hypothetical protein